MLYKILDIFNFSLFWYRFSASTLMTVQRIGTMEFTEAHLLVRWWGWSTESLMKEISVLSSSQGYAVGIVYFCFSPSAAITETDAAKSASEQDLSGRTARGCSVASLTNAAWSAQEPYDHQWISGATDYQRHHGMKLLVSHGLQGFTRFKNSKHSRC